jgi:hypothetical protein
MAKPRNRNSTDLDRRKLLRACLRGVAAGMAGLGLSARRAVAEDATLQVLIQRNQRGDSGPGFASAARAMPMPNPSLPTLWRNCFAYVPRNAARFETHVNWRAG